jgi:hypothetical protein
MLDSRAGSSVRRSVAASWDASHFSHAALCALSILALEGAFATGSRAGAGGAGDFLVRFLGDDARSTTAAAGEASSSSSSSRVSAFVRFLGMTLAAVFLGFFLVPKSEFSESDVYFTGAFARPERRVDMFASGSCAEVGCWKVDETDCTVIRENSVSGGQSRFQSSGLKCRSKEAWMSLRKEHIRHCVDLYLQKG